MERGQPPAMEFHKLAAGVMSNEPALQLECTTEFRTLLSRRKPPFDEVIATGVVPRFLQFLFFHHEPQLQFEAAWALEKVSSSSKDNRVLLQEGAVPIFVQLLSSHGDVREKATRALGYIAGSSTQCRDLVLQHGAMGPLLRVLMESSNSLPMLRSASWALSKFCHAKPQPPSEVVGPALPTLSHLICSQDEEVLANALWSLSHLSEGPHERIQAVIDAGICSHVVKLLSHTSSCVRAPALRIVGNILTGDESQAQVMINASALPCFLSLLCCSEKGIRKDACWALSNVTAGSRSQIQAVIEANIIPPLIHILSEAEAGTKKEAAWAISNVARYGSPEQIHSVVEQGCIRPLCDLLAAKDARVVELALETLEGILEGAQRGYSQYANEIEQAQGSEKILQLQTHRNSGISQKAAMIQETYFSSRDKDEDEDHEENDEDEEDGGGL